MRVQPSDTRNTERPTALDRVLYSIARKQPRAMECGAGPSVGRTNTYRGARMGCLAAGGSGPDPGVLRHGLGLGGSRRALGVALDCDVATRHGTGSERRVAFCCH